MIGTLNLDARTVTFGIYIYENTGQRVFFNYRQLIGIFSLACWLLTVCAQNCHVKCTVTSTKEVTTSVNASVFVRLFSGVNFLPIVGAHGGRLWAQAYILGLWGFCLQLGPRAEPHEAESILAFRCAKQRQFAHLYLIICKLSKYPTGAKR